LATLRSRQAFLATRANSLIPLASFEKLAQVVPPVQSDNQAIKTWKGSITQFDRWEGTGIQIRRRLMHPKEPSALESVISRNGAGRAIKSPA
jgi:hypothetical protein